MSRKTLLFLTILLTLGLGKAQAQDLNVTYTSVPGLSNTDTLKIYMRSTQPTTMDIDAVNFSFAYNGTCAIFQGSQSVFTDDWTTFLEGFDFDPNVNLTYSGFTFDSRFSYGNANPSLPFTNPVTIPSASQSPLLVMTLVFDGLCSDLVYMEDQTENPVNQIALAGTFQSIPYTVSAINSPFPVEVLSFEANIVDHETVALEWKTANEKNNDYFQVERSFDGILFQTNPNAMVEGGGNTSSETSYDYVDRGQMARTMYYRLKQVDFDGSYSRSNIIEVNFSSLYPVFDLTISAFPNPTTDLLNIEVDSQENSLYEIKLIDMTGRTMMREELSFGPSFSNRKKIHLTDFPTGMYNLEVTDLNNSGEMKTIRIVKK